MVSTNVSYSNYGEKGIKVCDKWFIFENFYNDMYDSYIEHCKKYGINNTSIDRIDVNGDYSPENCRWATWEEQSNNKSTNHYIEYNNETLTIAECIEKYADPRISKELIRARLQYGWNLERALHELPTNISAIQPIHFII